MRTALKLSVPLLALNEVEAKTIDAIASRIFPADDHSGGAHEAEVVVYIDRTLAGHARHLQAFYHNCLGELDAYCSTHFSGPFAELSEREQEEVLGRLDAHNVAVGSGGQLPPPEPTRDAPDQLSPSTTLRVFFDVIWEHTVQGMFCDPAYGGNRDAIGWRFLGFPGAQWSYSTEQRGRGFDATSIPIRTLADLQRERPWDTRPGIDLEKDKGDAPSN